MLVCSKPRNLRRRAAQFYATEAIHPGQPRDRGVQQHSVGLCSLAILALWTALPWMLLGAGGLVVETPSPDALCPPLEPTRESVRARLGEVVLEGTWRASYVLVHRAEGDFVALTLRDPQGVSRLERLLPVEGGSCSTLTQVIALVLERFFARLESEPATAVAASESVSAIAPTARTDGAALDFPIARKRDFVPDPIPSVTASASVTPPLPTAYLLGAGLWATTSWLAPSLSVTLQRGSYGFEATAGFDLDAHESRAGSGWVRLRRAPISLGISRQLAKTRRLHSALGLSLLGVYERATTFGLPTTGSSARLVPGLNAQIAFDFPLAEKRPSPFLALTSSLLLGGLSSTFVVDSRKVAEPPAFVVGLSFGIRTQL